MYEFHLTRKIDKNFQKLNRKNPKQLVMIYRKIAEIIISPHHYKNLRRPMQHLKRVRVDSLVLVFSVDEEKKTVIFKNFTHHDEIYKT